MSNLEHLIENTMQAIDEGLEVDEIKCRIKDDVNFKNVNISVDDIWEICQYFRYTYLGAEVRETEYTIDDICNELAQLIGIPCSVSAAEGIMMHKCDDCGDDIPDSECWKRYFEAKIKG